MDSLLPRATGFGLTFTVVVRSLVIVCLRPLEALPA